MPNLMKILAIALITVSCQKQEEQVSSKRLTAKAHIPAKLPSQPLAVEEKAKPQSKPEKENLWKPTTKNSLEPKSQQVAFTRPGERQFRQAITAIQNKEQARALELYLESCGAGYAYGCHRYAYHISQKGNWANARQFYDLACKRGLGKSCNNLGWALEQVGAFEPAKNYYSWGCLKRHKIACQNLQRVQKKTTILAR